MQETDNRFTEKRGTSLAGIVAAGGPMDDRKAMGIVRALCSRLMDETGLTETDLTAFHPETILLSSRGTISFSGKAVSDSLKEPYLPPEYVKGSTSKETVMIYGLGMLLLFLVTGQEKRSGIDISVKNPTVKTIINRCTALDSRRRYQSLTEVRSAVNRELVFPRTRMKRLAVALVLCLAAASSVYLYTSGRAAGKAAGESVGFRTGYRNGYETAVTDAPGIGIENVSIPDGYGKLYGNLNSENGAFAAADGDHIYYACDGVLYRMDPYSGNTSVLARHKELFSLNYWKGFLFYQTENALVRFDVSSGQETVVSDALRGRFCICDGTIFLNGEGNTGFLYGINAASLEIKQMNSDKNHGFLNAADGRLYYTVPDKGDQLYRSDYDGGNAIRLLSRPCRDIALCGERIYCLTADGADGEPDTLVSMDLTGGEADVLTDQPISRFCAEENGIFYISAASGYLEWMTPDGKTRYTICTSPVSDFNVAGRWIFCRMTGSSALYRMRIDGSDRERLL